MESLKNVTSMATHIKRPFTFFILFLCFQSVFAEQDSRGCQKGPSWVKRACHRMHQIWYDGKTELYLTGYAWHNRYVYDPSKISRYNELAWGGGFGKGFYDEDGDWHGITAFAFLDSHKNIEPVAGYAFIKMLHFNENTRLGAGYSLLVTQRVDINHGIPFPGALPWVMFSHRQATLAATYIPGFSRGVGNVLFIMGKWTFGDP